MKFQMQLSPTAISILVSNGLLLLAVLIFKWDALSVFALYIIETIVIGLFHIVKMTGVFWINNNVKPKPSNWSYLGLIFIILFFTFHFGIFVFIQTTLVLPMKGTNVFETFFSIREYINKGNRWFFYFFIASNLYSTFRYFFIDEAFEGKAINDVMMEPYPRIFVQQFVVIFGSFFLAFKGTQVVFLFIFIVTKSLFEVLVSNNANWQKE